MDEQDLQDHPHHNRDRQPADVGEHRNAIVGDRLCDQRQHAEGGHFHDDPDEVEQHLPCRLQQVRHRAPLLARQDDAKTEQHRKEDDRQHVAIDQRLDDIDWNDADQLIVQRLGLAQRMRNRIAQRRTRARFDQQANRDADRHRAERREGKQPDRARADRAELARIGERGDPRRDADEDDRDDEHPDQPHEQFADDGNGGCRRGPEQAEQHADHHRPQDPLPQRNCKPAAKKNCHRPCCPVRVKSRPKNRAAAATARPLRRSPHRRDPRQARAVRQGRRRHCSRRSPIRGRSTATNRSCSRS